MATYDADLFHRLVQAADMAATISRGLMGQLVEAGQREIHARGVLTAAEARLREHHFGPQPEPGQDLQDWGRQLSEVEQAREAERASLRAHARHMPPGAAQSAAEQLSALHRPPRAAFEAAVQTAAAQLTLAERDYRATLDRQQRAGGYAGRLLATAREAREFLQQHAPHLLLEAA